jgi:hypothetical protein
MKDNDSMSPKGYGAGVQRPSGSASSDSTGERRERLVNGVGMGKADATGSNEMYNGGRHKGVCYSHGRKSYQ